MKTERSDDVAPEASPRREDEVAAQNRRAVEAQRGSTLAVHIKYGGAVKRDLTLGRVLSEYHGQPSLAFRTAAEEAKKADRTFAVVSVITARADPVERYSNVPTTPIVERRSDYVVEVLQGGATVKLGKTDKVGAGDHTVTLINPDGSAHLYHGTDKTFSAMGGPDLWLR
jgi:hypothetical protein